MHGVTQALPRWEGIVGMSFQRAHALRPLPPRSLRNLGGPPHFEKTSGGTTASILNVLNVGAGSMLTVR